MTTPTKHPGIYVADAWVPTSPPLTNGPSARLAATYTSVVAQFDVANNPRYTRRNGNTFCNIFVWDVTAAMSAIVPHWVDSTGNPVPMGKGKELDANAVCEWVEQHGAINGWSPCTEQEAVVNANQGCPTIAIWKNVGGIGHVAIVIPSNPLVCTRAMTAQSGARNFFDEPVTHGFGNLPVSYYKHL